MSWIERDRLLVSLKSQGDEKSQGSIHKESSDLAPVCTRKLLQWACLYLLREPTKAGQIQSQEMMPVLFLKKHFLCIIESALYSLVILLRICYKKIK